MLLTAFSTLAAYESWESYEVAFDQTRPDQGPGLIYSLVWLAEIIIFPVFASPIVVFDVLSNQVFSK